MNRKILMLTQQLNLQNQAVAQYANILAQAQTQLAAAQAANDPERINQATQAVTNAQTALNNANAAVKNTEAQLQAVNNELSLASNGWYSAGEAMRTAQAAITTIGNDIFPVMVNDNTRPVTVSIVLLISWFFLNLSIVSLFQTNDSLYVSSVIGTIT